MKTFKVAGRHFDPKLQMAHGCQFHLLVKAKSKAHARAKINKCKTNIVDSVF